MSKTILNGYGSKGVDFNQNLKSLILDKVAVASKLKLTLSRDGSSDKVLVPTIKTGVLVESQDKIKFLTHRQNAIRRVLTVANDDAGTTEVFSNAILDVGTSGEIVIDDSDSLNADFQSLGKITADSYIDSIEGATKGATTIMYKKNHYNKSWDSKPFSPIGVDFFVLPADVLPESVEITYGSETVKITSTQLLSLQEETFGIIRKTYAVDNSVTDHYGTVDAVLVDVRGVQKFVINDEAQANDFTFYSVTI